MINMVSRSNNPMQLMQTMAQSNPQLQSILNLIQTSQKSPKDLFFEMAQQRGVDLRQILHIIQHKWRYISIIYYNTFIYIN